MTDVANRINRSADDLFDTTLFVDDVLGWLEDNDVSRRALAKMADLDLSSLLIVLRGDGAVSLLIACALANVCELSLDEYRLPLDGEEGGDDD